MDLALFKGVVDQIFDQGWSLLGIHFGLFGDGLVDPHVVERARYARERLPEIMLDVNTNGAAFDRKRHGSLDRDLTLLTLHCESIRPDTYDQIMTPLRAKNVFPKYEPILDSFPGKVRVSVPVSRMNRDDIEETRDWFLERGAKEVVFDPLASRCTDDQSLFRRIAFTPVEIRCNPDILDDVIIDCDGLVLSCCQDFERREPIGNVAADGLLSALQDTRRAVFHGRLAAGSHGEIETCRRCAADVRTPNFPFDLATPGELKAGSHPPPPVSSTTISQ
ncbi:SPASM domain-containing protein [Novosphingobium sp. AP12]|uniref:SPASM domain-containing protein n=1 Tax=Novosphingobium sp. AP12 TaxID=1144305 RepID=UPI0002720F93|nr:SPASM domain-containing protein [Novosphingobium sp. AP12]EJL33829.1 hypothetical protein PMI02_00913 [Novosphingobium sp. AP12]